MTVANHSQHLHRTLQFAVRRTLASRTLDEILAERVDIDESVAAEVRKDAETFGVRVGEMGLKDVILPGEMRDILNQVVTAEKQSQANLIRRREETAATRSLLNTVKLMEDNPLMVRLKELETPIGRGVPPPRLLPTAFPKTVGSHPLGGERRDPGPT